MPKEGRQLHIIDLLRETSTAHRSGPKMETKLDKIAQVAKMKPEERFTSLYHLLNEEMLQNCHRETNAKKASGVDGITKAAYETNLTENLQTLVKRLKNFSYRPQPSLRVHIPKENGATRPLGISAYEDKLVQMGLVKILNAVYEQDFIEDSYGFRPKRGCHDALKAITRKIEYGKVNYIVDADIKGFFDHVDHNWLVKFLEHRIADPNIIRLVKRMLRAGVMENGNFQDTEEGTPQGSCVSPVLANVYLHYVLDLWFVKKVKQQIRGTGEMVRYADDFVCCFQYKSDAENFLSALRIRLAKFGLSLAEEKSKIIEFGRFANENSQKNGKRPGTFDFLGFTHYCGKSKMGHFRVKRKTSKKKMRSKLTEFKTWIKETRNKMKLNDIMEVIKTKLTGHYRYYGITDNSIMMRNFYSKIIQLTFKWLNRRSQRKSFEWPSFTKYLRSNPLPLPRIFINVYG